jgi:acetyl esterase/lipase
MKKVLFAFFFVAFSLPGSYLSAQMTVSITESSDAKAKHTVKVYENLRYKTGDGLDVYEKDRCKLDLYVPEKVANFPVIVWFHGGSLKFGSKDDPDTKALAMRFADEGIAVALVNYRLFPQAKFPSYLKDAAAAVAWTIKNISTYGGNPKTVFVGGHSAGAYLTYMIGFAPQYLQEFDIENMSLAGLIPVAGQTFTHYTIREERGIPNPESTPIIDEAAPSYNARKDTPPILIAWAEFDSPVTIAENRYLVALLEKKENKKVSFIEIKDHNHMELVKKITEPDDQLAGEIIRFVQKNKNK